MAWITPKTDWVATDYLNFDDLNRIENNIKYLSDYINIFMTSPTISTSVLTRDKFYIEFFTGLNRIESDILALKLYTPFMAWVEPKTNWIELDSINYIDLNRMENDILALKDLIDKMIEAFRFCGEERSICGTELQNLN